MPERDAHDESPPAADSAAPHTPRVSGEVRTLARSLETPPPASGDQEALALEEAPVLSEPSDTLLSAGKPADRFEIMLEDRLAVVDERLRELDGRIAVLEQKRSIRVEEPRQKPWLWIVFLIGLVVIFQLLRRVH